MYTNNRECGSQLYKQEPTLLLRCLACSFLFIAIDMDLKSFLISISRMLILTVTMTNVGKKKVLHCSLFSFPRYILVRSLRCLCRSTVNGVLTDPPPDCDNNATCTIEESSKQTDDISGLCLKEVTILREDKAQETVIIVTYSCLHLHMHDFTLGPELCANNETSKERRREVVCCAGSDYCNARLLLQRDPADRNQPVNTAETNNTNPNQGN